MLNNKDLEFLYLIIYNQKMSELFKEPSKYENEMSEKDWCDFWYNEDI